MEHIPRLALKVADEAFLLVAMLHRQHPSREDFSVSEILDLGRQLKIAGELRPGVATHVRQHCVANLPASSGNYRMLFETAKARRRLLLPGDKVHPSRKGKIWPDSADVPTEFSDLIELARAPFVLKPWSAASPNDLLSLRGVGMHLGREADPDQYLRELRL